MLRLEEGCWKSIVSDNSLAAYPTARCDLTERGERQYSPSTLTDAKTYSDQLVIKLHKAQKEGEKTQKWFNNLDWLWVNDIPTLLSSGYS